MRARLVIASTLSLLLVFHSDFVSAQDSFSYSDEEIKDGDTLFDSGDSVAETEKPDTFSLPECTKKDQIYCKEECHTKFDAEFHDCVDKCYSTRCTKSESESSTRADEASGMFCVENQSAECAKKCVGNDKQLAARCTRSCLLSRCPEADPMMVAKESLDPGSLGCERCRLQNERSCARACRAGTFKGTASGLAQFGCEKACLMSYCSKSCGAKLPL